MYEAEDMVIAMEEELQAAWTVCKILVRWDESYSCTLGPTILLRLLDFELQPYEGCLPQIEL